MQLSYLKMHGAGNRILVVDERRRNRPPPSREQLLRLSDPATGPGFDQLMWVGPAGDAALQASYRVFNADASEVEQCGNGVRCVAWMLAAESGEREMRLQSPAGPVEVRILAGNRVAVSMGVPVFEPELVPFVAERARNVYDLEVKGRILQVSVLSMGNPHCVVRVDDVEHADVAGLGPAIERHGRFPARCNVGFMAVNDRHAISLRVHERGVGETRACGTGACAAVVAARRLDLVDDDVAVDLPGGQLMVSWRRPVDPVWLTGNAELHSEGSIDL